MTLIPGVDVSHYQTVDDVRAAVAAGVQYVVVKASDGLSSDNPNGTPYHDVQVAIVRNAGVRVGHYHFARHVGQYQQEADHFLALAKPRPGDLLALDLESMDGTWAQRASYACAWLHYVAIKTGAKPFWYVNKDWRSHLLGAATAGQLQMLAAYPLWVATAGLPAGQPGVPYVLHQYSTAGGIDHDVAAPGVDLSTFAIPGGTDVALTNADAVLVATTIDSRWQHDGVGVIGMIERIYDAVHTPPPPVDVQALATALAPLVHTDVDVNALAAALAPVVAPQVLQVLADHPLVPKA